MASILQQTYPWTSQPLIANGPMAGFAGPELATAITKAGGLGFIGAGYDLAPLPSQFKQAKATLSTHPSSQNGSKLSIGIGFLCFACSLDDAVAVVKEHQPVAVWLYATKQLSDYGTWANAMRNVSDAKIWVQTGSVADAVKISEICRPDTLVVQGSDAGGHGLEKGAGVIALLPETADAMSAAGMGDVPLMTAGGIVDGRGVAAALVLGAAGVVMGTRFLASSEITNSAYQKVVLAGKDGGQNTTRSKIFDELRSGGNPWPVEYDGRGLVNASVEDFRKGMSLEENRRLFGEAANGRDGGLGEERRRVTVWAGTGVGLVNEVKPAGEIVAEVRSEAVKVIEGMKARL
ncbi:NPD-domain-containing protein [Saccharata proteae CBS 121410]|uniref:NPD-domain-containing protein n=1 Tax=Saccharata proteae CBS 121410 TaxID=1314787 RepID=A0A9P4HQT1_9PEZI|nr:NPD-domain-containing protein [Saccharata proteae CBS 121410]